MSKDAYWFRHDSNARSDAKIMKLMRVHGAAGYGIYWILIECLRDADGYELPWESIEDIAYQFHLNKSTVELIIHDFDLFDGDAGKVFYSPSLKSRMKEMDAIRESRSRAGKESARKRALKQKKATNPTSVEQNLTGVPTKIQQSPTIREEKSTGDKKREEDRIEEKRTEENTKLVRAREEPTIEMDIIKTGTLIDRMKEPWDALHRQLCDSPQKWEGRAERALVEIRKNITARPGVDNDEKILEIWEFILNARHHWPEWNARPENMKLHLVASQFDSIWAGIKAKGQAKKKTTNPSEHEWGQILDNLKNGKK